MFPHSEEYRLQSGPEKNPQLEDILLTTNKVKQLEQIPHFQLHVEKPTLHFHEIYSNLGFHDIIIHQYQSNIPQRQALSLESVSLISTAFNTY